MTFVDSSFWYSLWVKRDAWHRDAAGLWATPRRGLTTTNLVVGETWTLTRRRVGHAAAVGLVGLILRQPRLDIVHVDEQLEREMWRWLIRHDEREYSFVDAASFAVMRKRRIHEALAFDGDFAAAGFVELRP